MPLVDDVSKIVRARVIPWELEFGIAYETGDGNSGRYRVGTKAEAEAALLNFWCRLWA